jgi:hypothetical protein
MKPSIALCALSLLGATAQLGLAHEINQRVGGYKASDGQVRSNGGLSATINRTYSSAPISSASYTLDGAYETITVEDISEDKYMSESFPEGFRSQRSVNLSTSHTFDKLTDFRFGGGVTSDLRTKSRNWSSGIGHWWFHETIQTNIDFSRTVVDRPYSYILDYDAETIDLPAHVNSGGGSLSFKHLATPTTMWGGAYARVESSDRPRLDSYSLMIRQYIPVLTASVQGNAARLLNTGPVGLETATGSLAGVQFEFAVMKSLWDGASGRAGYRYAREDEFTRAYGDHLVQGSDSYSLGISQDIKKGVLADRALTVSANGTRYITNIGVAATLGEAGLSVKF